MFRRTLLGAATGLLAAPAVLRAQAPITLNGASQFGDEHVFNRCMARFEELVRQYYNRPINIVRHKNSSRGLEKQCFE